MTNQQSQLFALPPRYNDPQQLQQVLEELAIQLDAFLGLGSWLCGARRGSLPQLCLSLGRSFLFSDGIVDAVYESDEEGEVDGAGDAGSVAEVGVCEFGDEGSERAFWRKEFGLGRHFRRSI